MKTKTRPEPKGFLAQRPMWTQWPFCPREGAPGKVPGFSGEAHLSCGAGGVIWWAQRSATILEIRACAHNCQAWDSTHRPRSTPRNRRPWNSRCVRSFQPHTESQRSSPRRSDTGLRCSGRQSRPRLGCRRCCRYTGECRSRCQDKRKAISTLRRPECPHQQGNRYLTCIE
jgi:hypothetical protein